MYYIYDEKFYTDEGVLDSYLWDNVDDLSGRDYILDDDYEDAVLELWEDVEEITLDRIVLWFERTDKIKIAELGYTPDVYYLTINELISLYCKFNDYERKF